MSAAPVLPETAAVYWRPRLDAARLRRREQGWTASTLAHTVPFLGTAVLLMELEPLSFPVAAIAMVHAWGIPSLYANRGATVVRPRPRTEEAAERTALGLLGDLLGHEAREVHARTGLALEREQHRRGGHERDRVRDRRERPYALAARERALVDPRPPVDGRGLGEDRGGAHPPAIGRRRITSSASSGSSRTCSACPSPVLTTA